MKVRARKIGNLILFVVDASGSMAARQRMVAVKGAIVSLLVDAYQKRDRVGLIAFRGRSADLLLPPTNSVDLAERLLRSLPTGGRTPIGHGLELAADTIERARMADRQVAPLLVLVSDCRPNVPLHGGTDPLVEIAAIGDRLRRLAVQSVVIDSESGPMRVGEGREIAWAMSARYLPMADLAGDTIARAVRGALPRTGPEAGDGGIAPSPPAPARWLGP